MKSNHDINCVIMNVNGFEKESTECNKLFGTKVDCKMKFKNYLEDVIKKACNRVNTFSRIKLFTSLAKKRRLTNSFLSCNSVIVHLFGCFVVAQ